MRSLTQQHVSIFPLDKGFTLLELLLAIAIFSVISLSSFTLFDTILNADEKSQQGTARQNELQRAFMMIERDFLQLSKRSIRFNGEAPTTTYIYTESESFSTDNATLGFVRSGWTNPGLLLPRSSMQAVMYQLNESTLERMHYNFVDAVVGQEAKVRPLITDVEQVDYEFYYNQSWLKKHKDGQLPKAIAIELQLKDYGLVRREFLVSGDADTSDDIEG